MVSAALEAGGAMALAPLGNAAWFPARDGGSDGGRRTLPRIPGLVTASRGTAISPRGNWGTALASATRVGSSSCVPSTAYARTLRRGAK
jgi:hypothetical protein